MKRVLIQKGMGKRAEQLLLFCLFAVLPSALAAQDFTMRRGGCIISSATENNNNTAETRSTKPFRLPAINKHWDANRMDPYVDEFQANGASLVMIAKGNRSQQVTDACQKHGGFYLGTIGGVAAVLSQSSIKSIECVEYPELGMEAVWKIQVEDFPAFILVDDKGNDFFKQLKPWTPCGK